MKDRLRYQNLRNWKYRLARPFSIFCPIYGSKHLGAFIEIEENGLLTLRSGYCWDGASGPTWDSSNTMIASLVHDALYQLMRQKIVKVEHRKAADQFFRRLLRENGMGRIRAWYYYKAVRAFGWMNTKPEPERPIFEI